MSEARTTQIGGDHYANKAVQPWDAMECWLSPEQFEGFLLGSAIAYLARYNTRETYGKGGALDVAKAKHYLEKLLEAIHEREKE